MTNEKYVAIDPGYEQSAFVLLDGTGKVSAFGIEKNEDVLRRLMTPTKTGYTAIIEEIVSYGMPVGREVFQTVRWAGRFEQALVSRDVPVEYLPRLKVKLALCRSPKANDAAIRQALLDLYGPGREKAIGTKKAPGPLYGFKADCWAALAVGIAWIETQKENKQCKP